MMHRKTSMGLKMTGRCLTVTHKPLTPCSPLYPALFSMVLLSLPLLTSPLTTTVGVINCLFCNKMPFNWTLLFKYFFSFFFTMHGMNYTNKFELLGFMSQVEVLLEQHPPHILIELVSSYRSLHRDGWGSPVMLPISTSPGLILLLS